MKTQKRQTLRGTFTFGTVNGDHNVCITFNGKIRTLAHIIKTDEVPDEEFNRFLDFILSYT